VDHVNTVVTPGKTVDVIVTDRGVAVNPRRQDLIENLKAARIPLMTIEELCSIAKKIVGVPQPIEYTDKLVGLVAYRNNSIIDVIRQVRQ